MYILRYIHGRCNLSCLRASVNNNKTSAKNESKNSLFDQRLENALGDSEPYFMDHLKNRISKVNALAIVDYVLSMKVETNLSANHRRGIITSLKLKRLAFLSTILDGPTVG